MKKKTIIQISTFLAAIAWILVIFTDLSLLFSTTNNLKPGIGAQVPLVMLYVFIFAIFFFYRYRIEKAESVNFTDLLWQVFVTGLVTTIISLLLRLVVLVLGTSQLTINPLFLDFIFLTNLGLMLSFIIATFMVWKRLILYQKSKRLLNLWVVFEYGLLISLVLDLVPIDLPEYVLTTLRVVLILLGLVLSVNMKWVAYLNFRQKWRSLLLIFLGLFYLVYFFWSVSSAAVDLSARSEYFLDFSDSTFIIATVAFVFIYALFSLLVILFNLPTSSVFEQKLEEVVNFQRLSQSIQTEQSEERVFDILLETAMSTVFADAGYLEIHQDDGKSKFIKSNIDPEGILNFQASFRECKLKIVKELGLDKTKYQSAIKGSPYKSVLYSPIYIRNNPVAVLVLLKDVTDGFNREMTRIVDTFTNQAGISIENFRLLRDALENERYKETIKIAKKVQKSLLPEKLNHNEDFEIAALSEAADEVGGDYYDTIRLDPDRVVLIIGDVSGKGTSAAFQMSQMKGVFLSLAQLDPSPGDFMIWANNALSLSLEKKFFITASYFIIDQKEKKVTFARAGHCPTLFYSKKDNKVLTFKSKGLGLGILRNGEYKNYVEVNTYKYNPSDVLLMYTDGVTEARNESGEEFGFERLKSFLDKANGYSPDEIRANLAEQLLNFTGKGIIDDDYTMLVVKFREN